MNLGYACINMTLSGQKPKVTTNRSMIKKTFNEKGLNYAGELGVRYLNGMYRMESNVLDYLLNFSLGHLNTTSKIYHNMHESKLY